MSQTDQILAHLERKPITALEALRRYSCNRLAARINDLRDSGYTILTETLRLPNNKRVARYHLVGAS